MISPIPSSARDIDSDSTVDEISDTFDSETYTQQNVNDIKKVKVREMLRNLWSRDRIIVLETLKVSIRKPINAISTAWLVSCKYLSPNTIGIACLINKV